MKNRFRTVSALALVVAGFAAGCSSENKSGMMNDKSGSMSDKNMAMDKGMTKTCAQCGMTCDANGKCPHCDAGTMGGGSTMTK